MRQDASIWGAEFDDAELVFRRGGIFVGAAEIGMYPGGEPLVRIA